MRRRIGAERRSRCPLFIFARVVFVLDRHDVVAVAASRDSETGTVIRCDGNNVHGVVAEMADGIGAHAAISRMKIARAIGISLPPLFYKFESLANNVNSNCRDQGARFMRRGRRSGAGFFVGGLPLLLACHQGAFSVHCNKRGYFTPDPRRRAPPRQRHWAGFSFGSRQRD
jgi:hypothetical protein